MSETKKCSKCGDEKPLEEFYMRRSNKRQSSCKKCYVKLSAKNRERERIRREQPAAEDSQFINRELPIGLEGSQGFSGKGAKKVRLKFDLGNFVRVTYGILCLFIFKLVASPRPKPGFSALWPLSPFVTTLIRVREFFRQLKSKNSCVHIGLRRTALGHSDARKKFDQRFDYTAQNHTEPTNTIFRILQPGGKVWPPRRTLKTMP